MSNASFRMHRGWSREAWSSLRRAMKERSKRRRGGLGRLLWLPVRLVFGLFELVFGLVFGIIGLVGRFVAITLGLVLIVVGIVLSLTLIGAIIGVPLGLFGLLLVVLGLS